MAKTGKTVKDLWIETERLIIKPYEAQDLDACFRLMQNEELFKYLDMHVMTRQEYEGLFRWLIDSYEVGFDEDYKFSFNITLKDSGAHIGWCGIGGVEFDHTQKEIFYLIGRDYWGKGYAKEAATVMLDYGFHEMGVQKIVGMCKPENIASRKVLESLELRFQYVIEGLPEEFDFYNGEPLFSLTRDEYLQRA